MRYMPFYEGFECGDLDFGRSFFERPAAQARTSEKKLLPKPLDLKPFFGLGPVDTSYLDILLVQSRGPGRTYNENFQPADLRDYERAKYPDKKHQQDLEIGNNS